MNHVTKPRTILITGASTGIGAACALELDRLGHTVYAGVRKAEDGQRLRDQATSRLQPMLLDVTDPAAIRSAAESIAAAVGPRGLQGLVNNAGIIVPGPLELLPAEDFRRQFEVNVLGTQAVTQAMLPLVRSGQGRIVIVGSIAGRVTPPFMGAYAATKHALEAVADALRMELRMWQIPVSLVQPDNVATSIWGKFQDSAEALMGRMPGEVGRKYAAELIRAREAGEKMGAKGMPVAKVVAAIRHALLAPQPKSRYPLGLRTRLAIWAAGRLSDRLMDYFMRDSMGLK